VKELWLIGAAALVRARRFARAFGGPDGRRAGWDGGAGRSQQGSVSASAGVITATPTAIAPTRPSPASSGPDINPSPSPLPAHGPPTP
jgi:hypothetical protein